MHAHSIDQWRHEHVFLGADHDRNERRSWAVVMLCVTMMTAEIIGGMLWGSMALIADGLHMPEPRWRRPPQDNKLMPEKCRLGFASRMPI
jgi:hypothetical protein